MNDVRAVSQPGAEAARTVPVLAGGRAFRLWVFDAALACCAVEYAAATARPVDDELLAGAPEAANVLVVSGTLTDVMAPAVRRVYDRMPEQRLVMSYGACATCGGPYWDSYSVTKGVDQLIEVDVYVPGCPPRPEALLDGLRVLAERVAA